MTILSLCQEVAAEIGVVAPTSLVENSDITAQRFLAAAKAAGQDLFRSHNWSVLHREYLITTTADEENYAVPEDWHKPIGDTAWDRSFYWSMRGNKSPAEWQLLKGRLATAHQLRRRFRLIVGPLAGSILIHPVPAATGDDLVIEYVSNYWCESSAGTGQATIAADTDEVRLDNEVFRLGLLWRIKRALGLAYADDRADYDTALRDAIKADIALPIVDLTGRSDRAFLEGNIPEGSWPNA